MLVLIVLVIIAILFYTVIVLMFIFSIIYFSITILVHSFLLITILLPAFHQPLFYIRFTSIFISTISILFVEIEWDWLYIIHHFSSNLKLLLSIIKCLFYSLNQLATMSLSLSIRYTFCSLHSVNLLSFTALLFPDPSLTSISHAELSFYISSHSITLFIFHMFTSNFISLFIGLISTPSIYFSIKSFLYSPNFFESILT